MKENKLFKATLLTSFTLLCLVNLPSCNTHKGYIKTFDPIEGDLTALGVGGTSTFEEKEPSQRSFGPTKKEKIRLSSNLGLYYQINGEEMVKFDIGIDNPDDYRLVHLIETDEFIEASIGSKEGLKGFEFAQWYNASPRNGAYMVQNERFDFHWYIIEKSTKRVAMFVGDESRYFPSSTSVSYNGCLYSIIDNPQQYGDHLLAKYYFDDEGFKKEFKSLGEGYNTDLTHLYKDDMGNLYFQYLNQFSCFTRFNENLEIEESLSKTYSGYYLDDGSYANYYLSPTNHLYAIEDDPVFSGHATIGFNEIDENGEQYDVRKFHFFYPFYRNVSKGGFDYDYGPSTIETACKLYEDDEIKYYNYGKMEQNLKELDGRFKYAKYYKDVKKQPYINSFELDELCATLGPDVYYIKENKVMKFNVVAESHEEVADIQNLNLFEVTSLYLGDNSNIYIDGYDTNLNTFSGVVENGTFSYVTTPSTTVVTTLIPLN